MCTIGSILYRNRTVQISHYSFEAGLFYAASITAPTLAHGRHAISAATEDFEFNFCRLYHMPPLYLLLSGVTIFRGFDDYPGGLGICRITDAASGGRAGIGIVFLGGRLFARDDGRRRVEHARLRLREEAFTLGQR